MTGDSADQGQGDAQRWTASNPPTRRDLAVVYLTTIVVWAPPILFATGLHDEAFRLLVMKPAEIMALSLETTIEVAAGGAAPEPSTASSGESVTADELSPGAFLVVAVLQLVVALVVIGIGAMAVLAGIAFALLYVIALAEAPRKSYEGTVAYYRASRGETA